MKKIRLMLARIIDTISDRVRWGYLSAFVLLLISYILTFYSSQQVSTQQERVHHTALVINNLDILLSELKDAESSIRGYFIMKDNQFLKDFNKVPPSIDSTFSILNFLTADNNIQQRRLDTLQMLIRYKLHLLSSGIEMFHENNFTVSDTMKKMGYQGKFSMDKIKVISKKLQNEENDIMINRSESVTNLSNFIKVINIASIVIAIILAFYSIITFNKENKARQASDEQSKNLRKQLENKIEDLNNVNTELLELRSIEKFAATGRISRTIAHEVRNPLTNINLATEHLRSEIAPDPEIDILFNMITRNSNRINDLISDLLNSTKTAHLVFKKVNINDVLDQSIGFAQDRIDLKKITVVKNYGNSLPEIMADIEKLNVAFLNIIVNAVEAMDADKGVLTITTLCKNDRCVVTISDNGKGMDKESMSKLFEPYFTTKEKGNGLGLTNTQNIILSHQAKVYAESEEGEGTSFIISFTQA